MSKRYNVIRNYKFFKSQYKYFVIFIKCGEYYYTFDSDAKIMMYLTNNYNGTHRFRILKEDFKTILSMLLSKGINVVLAGWKLTREYYSQYENKYSKLKNRSILFYKMRGEYFE